MVFSDPAVELPGFIGFYGIDVSGNSIVMTLIDNSGAADLLLPDGRFDRYYVGFGSNSINSVSLDGAAELNAFASVSVLAEGFELAVDDQFATGILQPVSYANGGILIELGAGTDLTDLNQTVILSFD